MWAVSLGLIGIGCFAWTIVTESSSTTNVIQSAVLLALCLAAAHILDTLKQIAVHTKKQDSALLRLLQATPHKKSHTDDDLAPVAPNWAEFKPRPPEQERDSGYQQRLARRYRYVTVQRDGRRY